MPDERLIGRVRIGSIEVESFYPDGPDADWWTTHELFDTTAAALSTLRKQVRAAGFPQFPDRKTEPLEETAVRAAGALPNHLDATDVKGSLAFVLVEIAREEYRLAQAMKRGDAGAAWRSGVKMGQIAEWWRWRRDGHDKRSVTGLAVDDARQRGTDARAAHNAALSRAAEEWKTRARALAVEYWTRNPRHSATAAAGKVRDAMLTDLPAGTRAPASGTIRKAIADLKPRAE